MAAASSSTSSTPITTFLLLLLLLSPSLSLVPPPSPTSSSHLPSAGFISLLRSTITQIQQVTTIVSTFSGALGGDLRLSSAVSDCLDLLDFSSDELSWSLSSSGAASTPTAADNSGTGDHRSDLRSWLSAALGNQETCKESLSSTGSLLASLASSGLDSITSLLSQGIRQLPAGAGGSGRRLMGGFPKWVAAADRRILQAAAVAPDVTVAKDGSGNFTTVNAAVEAAPAESGRRFVIYVKRGVYVENVEVKKKKWNLMFVGDGMDQTVISGSRNFVDGWTTFRSATFGLFKNWLELVVVDRQGQEGVADLVPHHQVRGRTDHRREAPATVPTLAHMLGRLCRNAL